MDGLNREGPTDQPPARSPELTEQQSQAISSRGISIALSAGAGCGKTYVLTRRFLSHLEPGSHAADLSRLVAITFTERAAREMRERIRKECRRRVDEANADQVDYWLSILRQLDGARISTIHSFCGALLRSHAVEAALDPRFRLLDEATSGSLLRNSANEGLQDLVARRDPDAFAVVQELGLERAGSLLEQLTLDRYRIDFAAWRDRTADELAELWRREWETAARPQLLQDLLDSSAAQGVLELLEDNIPAHPVMQERRLVLIGELPLLAKASDPLAAMDRLRQHARVQGGGGKDVWSDEAVYERVKDALEDLRHLLDRTRDEWEYAPEDLLPAAALGLALLRVTEKAGKTYDERKQAGAWLDFDDLLLAARNLLCEHRDVLRRISSGIELLLVDEFQDTDPIQTDIVRSLCGEAVLTGKLFFVGDVKQSIYRFRRAEPEVFRQLRREIPPEGRMPLTTNFRSQPAILHFVNALFDGALGEEYEPLVPSCRQLAPEPCIEFLFAVPGADEDQATATPDQPTVAARKREALWIARRLKQLLNDGQPRVRVRDASGGDTLRPLRPKDVVLLFRAMTDVRYYEAALREEGLDYYVIGGQAFFAQQEVFDLVNLCRTLDDPDDEVSLVGVLRSPIFALADDALLALGRVRSEASGSRALIDALASEPPSWLSEEQRERWMFAARVLSELRESKDRLPLAELLRLAVERTGYDAALLTEFLGPRKLANLRKLIDMARQFDRTGLGSLSDFVERLQESVGEEVREPLAATHPESSDVIRLMSIHQSKGLEFPLVVVVDMDRKLMDPIPPASFDAALGPLVALPDKFGVRRENLGLRLLRLREREENLAETLRLLYVATTRAADHLILSGSMLHPGRGTHPWLRLLSQRFDLQTGQPRVALTAEGISVLLKYAERLPEIRVHHRCPEPFPTPGAGRTDRLRLGELREALERAEPAELPASVAAVPVDRKARRRFSVSEIRAADAERRGGTWEPLDLSDEAREAEELTVEEEREPSKGGDSAGDDARLLGDIVHLVLERIDLIALANAAELVNKACRSWSRPIKPAVRELAVECVSRFLASPLAAELESAKVCHREIEFHLPWPPAASILTRSASEERTPARRASEGESSPGSAAVRPSLARRASELAPHSETPPPRMIVGKLDCLLQRADGAWSIVDYKTGRLPAGRTSAHVLAEYEMQLAIYALAVRQLTGKWPARAELVLLRHGAERVLFDPQTAPWETLTARIDAALAALTTAN